MSSFDPVTLAVIANRLDSIVREMENTLLRTGRSAVLNMARDFSCALITSGNELLASAEGLPIHVIGTEFLAEAMTELHGDTLAEGDAFLHNDPYLGNSHSGDHAILVQLSPLTFENQPRLVALAAQFRLPAVYELREFVDSGGLLSYGQVFRESFERSAALVDKILKGAKPADLPVEQPTRFELAVNLKTAKALGLTIPQTVLGRADEVIE